MGQLFSSSHVAGALDNKMVEQGECQRFYCAIQQVIIHLLVGGATGQEADDARRRMIAAGYDVPENVELRRIHCNTQRGCEDFAFLENGFVQCFVDVDGRSARVMDLSLIHI